METLKEFRNKYYQFEKEHFILYRRNKLNVDDVFWSNYSPALNYRGKWLRKEMPDVTGKTVLDIAGACGMWGAYLQLVQGMKFHYTCLDAGIYFNYKHKDVGITDETAFMFEWTLKHLGVIILEDATLPQIFERYVTDFLKKRDVNGRFVRHVLDNVTPLPFDGRFDQVWMFGWWAWTYNLDWLFNEIKRVLKPQGIFMFDIPCKPYRIEGTNSLTFTKTELESLIQKYFTVIKIENIPPPDNAPYKKTFGVICLNDS